MLSLILLSSVEAGPKDWIKHHKRFLIMEGAAITGAAIHYSGLRHCRRLNGVEPCDLHYGAAWANFWVVTSLTTVVMPSVAESCWKNEGGKFCYALAYGGPIAQSSWGAHEWRINPSKKDTH
jgi:hypothetical protein